MQILRAAAHRRMPWKNGGGETFEIAVSPPDATLDTLDWRVSMAVVTQDGPFSLFPGIERTLCILDGPGLQLDFGNDGGTHTVTPDTAPLRFAADRPVHARLLAGTITDLNVMTRRGRYRHAVRRLPLDAQQTLTTTAAEQPLLVLCERGSARCTIAGDTDIQLDARDCVLIRAASGPISFSAAASTATASLFLIELQPISA